MCREAGRDVAAVESSCCHRNVAVIPGHTLDRKFSFASGWSWYGFCLRMKKIVGYTNETFLQFYLTLNGLWFVRWPTVV